MGSPKVLKFWTLTTEIQSESQPKYRTEGGQIFGGWYLTPPSRVVTRPPAQQRSRAGRSLDDQVRICREEDDQRAS